MEPNYIFIKGRGWVPEAGTVTFFYTDRKGVSVRAEVRRPEFGEYYYRAGVVRIDFNSDWLERAKLFLSGAAYNRLSQRCNSYDKWYDQYNCIVLTPV